MPCLGRTWVNLTRRFVLRSPWAFATGLGELMSLPFFNISAGNSESWLQVGYGQKKRFCLGFVEFGHVESSNCKCL